jgi:hypothetical protein
VDRPKPTSDQHLIMDTCIRLGVPFFWRTAGTLLVQQDGVEDVVREIIEGGGELLGFEGFKMDSSIWPQLDCILSVDEQLDVELAIERVREWNPSTWIDITLSC